MGALATSNAYVVRAASDPVRVQPKPLRNGVLGFALALVLAVGLVAVSQTLDTRLFEARQIGDVLRAPLLGRLATRSLRPRAHRLGIATDPFGADAEVARLLKTRVEFAATATGARTIMVTGDAGHQRDAPAVAQLALAFAQGGRHVVVVDADVRAPTMDRVFECPREPGLLDVLAERCSLEEALVPVRSDGRRYATARVRDFARQLRDIGSSAGSLNILPAGGGPDEAREFVGTPEFARLLVQLRDGADVVLIHAPALLHSNEALALTRRVDGVVVIAHSGMSRSTTVSDLARVLDDGNAATLGFVFIGPGAGEIKGSAPWPRLRGPRATPPGRVGTTSS